MHWMMCDTGEWKTIYSARTQKLMLTSAAHAWRKITRGSLLREISSIIIIRNHNIPLCHEAPDLIFQLVDRRKLQDRIR